MTYFKGDTFVIHDYQKQKPFSSFLPGIAGYMGKPLWSFYVNRGQAISSFGLRDKNGAILEFYPANLAYIYTPTIGFRTFVKVDGVVHEFFKEPNEHQVMYVNKESVSIEESNIVLGIKVKVTYFTLPNMPFAGLTRKVSVENLNQSKKHITIIDGLTQLLPSGIDYGGYKAVSNLLQSWMISEDKGDFVFYKISASTADSAEVMTVLDGNYYITKYSQNVSAKYIYDYKLIFEQDSSLQMPYGLIHNNYDSLSQKKQASINQVPSAFSLMDLSLDKTFGFISLFGHAESDETLRESLKGIDYNFLSKKEVENKKLHDELLSDIETKTAFETFDAYMKQCYLDNLMRGGKPLPIELKDGVAAYHLFSRKHGDLERDYNFFSLEPSYYSQGNGNFRDVLQNRRNDVYFYPEIKDFNIYQFASLIQADGYNPLSIEGLKFDYLGKPYKEHDIQNVLSKPFSLGMIAEVLSKHGYHVQKEIKTILKHSKAQIVAHFGEGYWQDHFTYLYDLIDSYLSIYPDYEKQLFFDDKKYLYFKSPVEVLPLLERSVLTKQGKIRQYGAIKHHHNHQDGWLKDKDGQEFKVNLIGKLLTLVVTKYAALDQENIGIMYEAGKPGWNDAMNGLPGLFGSGVSETIELRKLAKLLKKVMSHHLDESVFILKSTAELANRLVIAQTFEDRVSALEHYRNQLETEDQTIYEFTAKSFIGLLDLITSNLKIGLQKAKKLNPIYPTYLTYEATQYEILKEDNKEVIGSYGLPLVKINQFELKPIVSFLEAPARYMASLAKLEEAKQIYHDVKQTELYDQKMKFYQTSVSLDSESHEIGRIKAFQKGWLERESNFLHMTYKYLLAMLKAGLYDEFYEEIKTNLTCFMDPLVYGRNPLENSSFLATSSNLDPSKHGQGFVARLSGSTAEMLSMWRYMFLGPKLFDVIDGELVFKLQPKLHHSFFKDHIVQTKLFRNTLVEYVNEEQRNTFDADVVISSMEITTKQGTTTIEGPILRGIMAETVRRGEVLKIKAYLKGGK